MANVSGEHFDQESFQKAHDNDEAVSNLTDKWDDTGVTLKGGSAVQSPPEDQTVDKMASRAAQNTLK